MIKQIDAPDYAVYLGSGLYIGGIVKATHITAEILPIYGDIDGGALSVSFEKHAEKYGRLAAIRMCHVARRAGVCAWVVRKKAQTV